MNRDDALAMAFYTSRALGLSGAQRAGNQLAAAELCEERETGKAPDTAALPPEVQSRLQALDDEIRALLSIGSESAGVQED